MRGLTVAINPHDCDYSSTLFQLMPSDFSLLRASQKTLSFNDILTKLFSILFQLTPANFIQLSHRILNVKREEKQPTGQGFSTLQTWNGRMPNMYIHLQQDIFLTLFLPSPHHLIKPGRHFLDLRCYIQYCFHSSFHHDVSHMLRKSYAGCKNKTRKYRPSLSAICPLYCWFGLYVTITIICSALFLLPPHYCTLLSLEIASRSEGINPQSLSWSLTLLPSPDNVSSSGYTFNLERLDKAVIQPLNKRPLSSVRITWQQHEYAKKNLSDSRG